MPDCLYSDNLHCYVVQLLGFLIRVVEEANAGMFKKTLYDYSYQREYLFKVFCLVTLSPLFMQSRKMFVSTAVVADVAYDHFS